MPWMSLGPSAGLRFFVLFLLQLFFSLFSSESIETCPYIHSESSLLPNDVPVITLTQTNPQGRFGNWVRCASNAMATAISCGGILKLPVIPGDLPFGQREVTFDFSSVKRLTHCDTTTNGCHYFFYKGFPFTTHDDEHYHWKKDYRDVIFPTLSRCFNAYLNFNRSLCSQHNLENALVVHIRNGDIYSNDTNPNMGQQPLCTIIAAIAHRPWEKVLVIAEVLNAGNRASGPLLQFLNSIRNVSRPRIEFVRGSFYDHLLLRTCAEHLYASLSTLNYLNHYHPYLKSLYDPCAIQCPLYPPKLGWVRDPDPVVVYRVKEITLRYDRDWRNTPMQLMDLWRVPCSPYLPCHYPEIMSTVLDSTVIDNPSCRL